MSMSPQSSDWPTLIVVGGLIAIGAVAATRDYRENKRVEADRVYIEKHCKKLGSAFDNLSRDGHEVRIIFQCPDGKMYLR